MGKYEPERLGNRLFDACIGLALAAATLYSAVWLLRQIWVWLAAIAVVVGLAVVGRWWWSRW